MLPEIPAVNAAWLASRFQILIWSRTKPKRIVNRAAYDPLLAQKRQPLTDKVIRLRNFPGDKYLFFGRGGFVTAIPSRGDQDYYLENIYNPVSFLLVFKNEIRYKNSLMIKFLKRA